MIKWNGFYRNIMKNHETKFWCTFCALVKYFLQISPFVPRQCYASAGICYGISICLCACLCVTHLLCFKTAKRFIKIFSPPDSPIIIVFRHRGSLLNSSGFTPNWICRIQGVRKLGDFWPISWCISETVWDTAIVASRMGNHTQAIEWWHFRWPYVTPSPVRRRMTVCGFLSNSWVKTCYYTCKKVVKM